jgi:hypothetical protein
MRRLPRSVFGDACPTYLSSTSRARSAIVGFGSSESMSTNGHRRPASSPGRSPHDEPGQPHGWARVLWDADGDELLRLLEGQALPRLRRPTRRQQHVRRRVGLDPTSSLRVLARLVEVVPRPVDRARGVVPVGHPGTTPPAARLSCGRPTGGRSPVGRSFRGAASHWRSCCPTSAGRGESSSSAPRSGSRPRTSRRAPR